MKRVPQRDLNIAREMVEQGQALISIGLGLVTPWDIALADDWNKQTQDQLLNLFDRLRQHERKINVVEKKGQRA